MSIQNRWIQPEASDRPQGVHAGQPVSPSASEVWNSDAQRRQEAELEPNMAPQTQDTAGGPLFTQHEHTASIRGILHPRFSAAPDEYNAATSPTQSPNDQGRSSKVPG